MERSNAARPGLAWAVAGKDALNCRNVPPGLRSVLRQGGGPGLRTGLAAPLLPAGRQRAATGTANRLVAVRPSGQRRRARYQPPGSPVVGTVPVAALRRWVASQVPVSSAPAARASSR